MRGLEREAEGLQAAREKAREEFGRMDPSWMASRSGSSYSYSGRFFSLPFCGKDYAVSFPGGAAARADGRPAGAREELIILHYLSRAGGAKARGEWISYRDLPGARYHEAAFFAEVEQPLSRGLSGRLDSLREWARRNARLLELPGDVSLAWEVLPRVPLLIIFNEADEEFPASARVLFDATAPDYLPTEDLSVLAGLAAFRLLDELGALPEKG